MSLLYTQSWGGSEVFQRAEAWARPLSPEVFMSCHSSLSSPFYSHPMRQPVRVVKYSKAAHSPSLLTLFSGSLVPSVDVLGLALETLQDLAAADPQIVAIPHFLFPPGSDNLGIVYF